MRITPPSGGARSISGGLVCLLVCAAFLVAGCNRPSDSRFADVTAGMTAEQVTAVLGSPSSSRRVAESDVALVGYSERWHYGDSLSSRATDAVFTDAPDARVFVVFFDDAGRVVRTQTPSPEPMALPGDPPAWRRDVR